VCLFPLNSFATKAPDKKICRLVASAVILPDTVEQPPSPSLSKRRQSSVSEVDSKRPRLSEYGSRERVNGSSPPAAETKTTPKSEESVKLEERKRGKRLFGALLGTLAQSSSSTAQNRRVDIERKQQAKLKLQDEEHDEKNKQKLLALMEVRRQEQKKYDKQSVSSLAWCLIARLADVALDANTAFQPPSHCSFSTDKGGTKAGKRSHRLGDAIPNL
jgi:hypothetical protein